MEKKKQVRERKGFSSVTQHSEIRETKAGLQCTVAKLSDGGREPLQVNHSLRAAGVQIWRGGLKESGMKEIHTWCKTWGQIGPTQKETKREKEKFLGAPQFRRQRRFFRCVYSRRTGRMQRRVWVFGRLRWYIRFPRQWDAFLIPFFFKVASNMKHFGLPVWDVRVCLSEAHCSCS